MSDIFSQFGQSNRGGRLTQLGLGLGGLVSQKRAERAQAEQLAQYQGLLKTATETGSPQDWFAAINAAPQGQVEQVTAAYETMGDIERQQTVQRNMEVISAIGSGNEDIAIGKLEELSTAFGNAGDERQSKIMQGFADQIKSGNSKQVSDYFTMMTGVAPEGKEALETLWSMGEDVRKTEASEADLLKVASDLNFSGEGLSKAMEVAEGNNLQTAKRILEFAEKRQSGNMETKDIFNLERELSDDYQKSIKNYNEIIASNDAVKAVGDLQTGAGDQALIVLFNKMLDPGSVVRESEAYATMQSQGVLQQIQAGIQRLATGEKLSPQLRTDLISATEGLMGAAEGIEERARKRLTSPIESYGLDQDNVFGPSEGGGNVNITSLRSFIKQNNPNSTANIDAMSVEEIKQAFPVGYNAFEGQDGGSVVTETMTSVDFFNTGGE
jgi:hypothetical protein